MTQIFTGTGLGFHGSSLGELGSYGPKGAPSLGQGGESVYVNGANGNFVLKQSDGFLADVGFGLDLFQIYNSRGEGQSPWRFNTDTRLEVDGKPNTAGSMVKRIDEDGHCSRFIYDERQCAYLAEDGAITQLTFRDDSWHYGEGNAPTSCNYNAQGQLTSLSDRDGHELRFSYQNGHLTSLVDTSGRQTVTWSFSQGLLRDVTWMSNDQTVHHLHYDYDVQNRLSKVSRDLGNGKTYWITYDYVADSNLISDIRQSDGTNLHIDYDPEGRVTRLVDGEGRITTYQYLAGKTIVTNGLGESWTYSYDIDARLTGIDGPENFHLNYHYEGKHLAAITQGNQRWQFLYNDAGDCIRIDDPSGGVTRRSYDSEHRLLSETHYQTFDGDHQPQTPLTTRFVYDEQGHLRFEITAEGTVTEYRYSLDGLRISSRCYLRGTMNTRQMPAEKVFTLNELTSWCQQQDQQAVSLVAYHYDWRGSLSEEIHYLQVDPQGEGILTNDALRAYSRYDATGRLVEKSSLTASGLSTTHYFYDDLGRLIKTIDNQHHEQTIEYDDTHQRIITTDSNGLQTIGTYDHSGLLLSTQRLDSSDGHQYGTVTYRYDAAGRLIAETNVEGKTSYSFYDQQGRLQGSISASGQVTDYLYDEAGHCIQTHQYQQTLDMRSLQGTLPAWMTIKPLTTSQDRITQVVYNTYHQIAYQIDAEGAVIGYQYDAEGRVIAKTAYANRLAHFLSTQRLMIGDIALIASSNDRNMSYYYDSEGRLQGEINGEGSATGYRYDNAGHLIDVCHYTNQVVLARTGNWGLDAPSNTNKDIHAYSLYNVAGLKIADIDAGGYVTEYRYDARGLLTDTIAYYTKLKSSFTPNDNTVLDEIRPNPHANDHRISYRYNDLNQLIEETNQSGLAITYAYDEQGLLINKTTTDSKTHEARQQRYRYDALGRIIQRLDELGAACLQKNSLLNQGEIDAIWQQHSIRYVYDNASHLLSTTNALNQVTRYFYNDAGLLTYTLNASGSVTENRYNAFNQIETTIRYSAYWIGNADATNTQQIKQYLTASANANLDEVTHYEYNSIGMVISKCQGTSGKLTTSYNAFGELETSALRTSANKDTLTSYQYDRRGLLRYRTEDVGGLNKAFEAQYDALGRMNKVLDGRQGATTYLFNKRGEQIYIEDPGHGKKIMTYDAFGRLLSVDDTTDVTYTYDDQNNTLTLMHTNTASKVVTQFNAFGDKITLTDGTKQTTHYQYDAKGQLIHIDAPEQTSTDYTYDTDGHLLFQQDAGGHILRYTYDAEGHVLTKTVDPDGLNLTTTYSYDGIGRQLQLIDNGRCTRFSYDNQGHLIKKCLDPDGLNLITAFSYTESGLLARQITYNPQGANKVIAYEWDALGRCTTTTIDPDGLKLTSRYEYDNNGNVICQTDANQHRIQSIYDANNRVRYRMDARGVVTEHCYDIKGNETKTITYANRIATTTRYDAASLVTAIKLDAAADHYQFFAYDKKNNVILSHDGLGYATRYTYDASGNVTAKTLYATPCSISALKAGGTPEPQGSIQDRTIRFAYDGLNQQRFQIDANRRVTEYRYDTSGQLTQQTRFATVINLESMANNYSPPNIQAHLQDNPEQDESTQYAYDTAGRLHLQLSPSGVATAYQYDKAGNIIATTQYAIKLTAPQRALTEWTAHLQTSTNDRTTHAVYDAASREIYRISPAGKVLERRYDAVGNVLTDIVHTQSLQLLTYDQKSIQAALGQDKTTDHQTNYQYDLAGRLLKKTDAEHHTTQYTYDNNNNVATKIDTNNTCWTYHYNEANQLIETLSPKTTFSTYKSGIWVDETREISTQNQYDSFGNLITVIRDAQGINQTIQYTFDSNNRKLDTLYPDRAINAASQSASNERQETIKTLIETCRYNAFGDVIASSDRAGHWRHWTYDNVGHMMYAVDAENNLTHYQYDALDNVSTKTTYATRLKLSEGSDYTTTTLKKAIIDSNHDRHDYYVYDKDHQLIESRKDAVNIYNARTGTYHTLSPTTTLTYNAFGDVVTKAVQLTDTDWAVTRSYYNLDGLKTATLDAEGYLTTYTYNEFCLLATEIQFAQRTTTEYTNTNEDYTRPTVDNNDRQVTFLYDALGQLTSKTLKQVTYQRLTGGTSSQYETITNDLTSRYGYDALGNLVSTTDAQGNTAYSYYNASGQLTAKAGASVKTGRPATSYRYDALGQLIESKQWASGAKKADESHLTLQGATMNDIIMNDVYDNDGRLIQQVDGTGHKTYFSYDANGNIARSWQVLNQANKTTLLQDKRYRYDAENHLTQSATIKANGQYATDDAEYNAFGEVTAKGVDSQLAQQIDYDKAGRVWRSNLQGYFQIYVYDLTNQVTQVVTSTNAFGSQYDELGVDLSQSDYEHAVRFNEDKFLYDLQRQDTVYDALGRLLSQTKDGSTSATDKFNHKLVKRASQLQQVDRWGNVVKHTNANGYSTQYDYNAFDQVVKQTLPEVRVVDEHGVAQQLRPIIYYAYDALGRSIAMTDANGHTVAKQLDAEGRVTQEIDALNHHRDKEYDLLGQLVRATNERGGTTTYAYDKANRLLSVTTDQTWQGYNYDGAGQLIQQTDGRGNVTQYSYDALGHPINREQAGALTTYEYDDAGHKTDERDAKGNTLSWSYDKNGRLQGHTDLGGHKTSYTYNHNGLILTEQSTSGKDLLYHYYSDGQLEIYEDNVSKEKVSYSYDAESNVLSKESSRVDAWIVETDHYQYDALGRLVQVRRRNPEDKNTAEPDQDHALLSVNYDYDAVGNIRHTNVDANYAKHPHVRHEDYFRYDANNRMIVNKGQLQNGQILMTASQGSELGYDESGNINTARKYENGTLQNYAYRYNTANLLELIKKNGIDFQTKTYDKAGNVEKENLYNSVGGITQKNVMIYEKGRLTAQITQDSNDKEVNQTRYEYDEVGNLTTLKTLASTSTQTHQYTYEAWDGYLQKNDVASLVQTGRATIQGNSERIYDVNGQLKEAIDKPLGNSVQNNSTQYIASSIDGIRARQDKDGQTSYLMVAGKTIGDLRLDNNNVQHLDIYGGFTPSGHPDSQLEGLKGFSHKNAQLAAKTLSSFFNGTHAATIAIEPGTLPEAPQDNLGAYTLQAGDTLDNIALQVYGDSSLWYLLADANGITDRNAHAGEKGSQLHAGQRLNIPPAASGQHYTNATHKVLNSNNLIGNTSATTPLPPTPPPPKNNHNSFFKTMANIVVAVVAVVATVLSAGALGLVAAAAGSISSLSAAGIGGIISAGMGVLGGATALTGAAGAAALSTATTLGIGFSAGFIGNIAAQGAANAFGLQKGIDLKGALITGLATAATAGINRALSESNLYSQLHNTMDNLSIDSFNIKSAAEMMEKDALSQSLNLALSRHQHFDWLQLSINGATAGLINSTPGKKINQTLNKLDKNTGILTTELQSLTTGATTSAATGSHFNATQVLTENLGNAVGSSLLQAGQNKDNAAAWNNAADNISEQGLYSSIPSEEGAYSAMPAGTYQRFHEEADSRAWNTHDSLTYHSELMKNWEGEGNASFKNNWNNRPHGLEEIGDKMIDNFLNKKSSNFDLLQSRIFGSEGGISNRPADFGGYTNKGITIATFENYAQSDLGLRPTLENLRKITNEQATTIYKNHFWNSIKADEINSLSIAYSLFDFHVNAPGHAVKILQLSVNELGGNLVVDNKMGAKTIQAINKVEPQQLFDIYKQNRIDYYHEYVHKYPSQKVFLNGWLHRVNDLKFEN